MARHQLVIDRPIDEVFRLVTAPETQPRWQPSIVTIERLDDGPFGLGSRVREVRTFLGHSAELVWEVTTYAPSRHAGIRVIAGCVDGRAGYELEPAGVGTRLHLEVILAPKGPARLAGRALRPAAEAELAACCRRLRRLLEAPVAVG
jgi:carbon monoxide dehydrogenase subunit G